MLDAIDLLLPDSSIIDLSFNKQETDAYDELTLVGKIISQKPRNHKAIFAVLTASWNMGTKILIKALDQNLIACTFRNSQNRDFIVRSGPWTVKGALLKLQSWPTGD